jgi:hypothetical protein
MSMSRPPGMKPIRTGGSKYDVGTAKPPLRTALKEVAFVLAQSAHGFT